MNRKLSDRLHSFPKDYQLNEETKILIETALQEEINNKGKKKKRQGFKVFLKKLTVPVAGVAVLALASLLFVATDSFNLFHVSNQPDDSMSATGGQQELVKVHEELEELSTIWANALKLRDGKPRYQMLSETAKEKFIQEQVISSGENGNYTIGVSSPWVVDFDIEVEGMNANIIYTTQTSEPAYYHTKETITFIKENDKLVVKDFQLIYEDRLYNKNFKSSISFPAFPIPTEAERIESSEDGQETFLYNVLGTNGGIQEEYNVMIESWGWQLKEELQRDNYYVFEKEGQYIEMTIQSSNEEDFFTIKKYENK
ncbi:hypothetical protein J2Z40_000432 [Cytobacillus eiseniae]|uniref:DUF4179 domain-containing protein n=1 Tax=Cytobacillus eiseniae TaxID=762947 RepID=A0ABS4RC17_9BACI|nr:hypothetical protein [Cytobacillus eiseniae]MBP2239879.1 hypothetical protein [Cytobacillus eiseniae]